jgi:hypothetical protein
VPIGTSLRRGSAGHRLGELGSCGRYRRTAFLAQHHRYVVRARHRVAPEPLALHQVCRATTLESHSTGSPVSREASSYAPLDEPIVAAPVISPELENDLLCAKTWYLTRLEHQSGKRRREDRKRAEKIIKAAKSLADLLDESGRRVVRLPLECPQIYLSQVVEAAEDALKPRPTSQLDRLGGERLMSELGIGRMSAFEWLAGQRLPEIFEKHSGIPATPRGDRTQPPDTRYVRFAVDALARLGIRLSNDKPHARESIAKAMSVAKSGGRSGKSH